MLKQAQATAVSPMDDSYPVIRLVVLSLIRRRFGRQLWMEGTQQDSRLLLR